MRGIKNKTKHVVKQIKCDHKQNLNKQNAANIMGLNKICLQTKHDQKTKRK